MKSVDSSSRHALVVGGSGMLGDVCLWLVEKGVHVSVIGRSKSKLQALAERTDHRERLHLISVDYTNDQELAVAVAQAVANVGAVQLLVTWIHGTAPNALGVIQDVLKHAQDVPWKHFQVNGSRAYLELPPSNKVDQSDQTATRQIILGFVLEGDSSRWHTNQEIAQGVIQVIESDAVRTIVGTCEPWAKRP